MTRYQYAYLIICFIVVFVGGVVMMAGGRRFGASRAARLQPATANPAKAAARQATVQQVGGRVRVFGGEVIIRMRFWIRLPDGGAAERPRR